jgi:hypothetical protein
MLLKRKYSRAVQKECFYFSEKAKTDLERFGKYVARGFIVCIVLVFALLIIGDILDDNDAILLTAVSLLGGCLLLNFLIGIFEKPIAARFIAVRDVIEKCAADSSFANSILHETNNADMKALIGEIRKISG